jgi:hypothetical protein
LRAFLAALACLALAACGSGSSGPTPVATATPAPAAQELRAADVLVAFQPADSAWAPIVHAEGVAGRENALRFFATPIAGELRIDVFPDRAALTAHWRRIWQQPAFQPECWMIASGDANGIVLLSPGAWTRDSCGHDGQDAVARARITAHEVVHVHHARANPSLGTTAGAMGWFVEGLAVYASGQLDEGSRAHVRDEIAAGRYPQRLSAVVPTGYSWAGSLVASIDHRYGRATVLDLLDEMQEAALLRSLGTTEADLLAQWRSDVLAGL